MRFCYKTVGQKKRQKTGKNTSKSHQQIPLNALNFVENEDGSRTESKLFFYALKKGWLTKACATYE